MCGKQVSIVHFVVGVLAKVFHDGKVAFPTCVIYATIVKFLNCGVHQNIDIVNAVGFSPAVPTPKSSAVFPKFNLLHIRKASETIDKVKGKMKRN